MTELIAQIIGFVAFAAAVISFQQNTHKRIVIMQTVSTTLFMIHFIMLGAYTGAILNGTAAVRSFIYANKDKKWGQSRIWLPLFCVLSVILGGLTAIINLINGSFTAWDLLCVFPIAGMVLTTVSFNLKDPKMVRIVSFPSSPLWIIYNVFNRSYSGILTEAFVMCSIIVAFIRYDIKPKNKQ